MLPVKISKSDQYRYENRTWIRLLEFFKQENAVLKNRLAEVVDACTDKEFLMLAEQFQNKFIIKDEFIDELRHDINIQNQEMGSEVRKLLGDKLLKQQEKLRHEMEFFEKDFYLLKNEFNNYLSSVL